MLSIAGLDNHTSDISSPYIHSRWLCPVKSQVMKELQAVHRLDIRVVVIAQLAVSSSGCGCEESERGRVDGESGCHSIVKVDV